MLKSISTPNIVATQLQMDPAEVIQVRDNVVDKYSLKPSFHRRESRGFDPKESPSEISRLKNVPDALESASFSRTSHEYSRSMPEPSLSTFTN
ncbi:Hypothetical predicted protein [Mytilus galloprovincialis]|uniref:Uncharacterized protein n=1 Tax=Mytilus galloprovincialis TaxID=29158 RepID=A0A8B6GAX6_MYTGA|nr:Hypothetical predicted protein [Mytilus galloprovincialis]